MVRKVTDSMVKLFGITFWVGILCGCIGVLVDIDHPISFALGWPVTMSRFLHPYALAFGGVVFIACCSCIAGLLFKPVLRRINETII
jgi:hypothetical protein